MTTDTIKGQIVFICDECDDTLETETSSFIRAAEIRRDSDWTVESNFGAWLHFCSTCGKS